MARAVPIERRCLPLHQWPMRDRLAWKLGRQPGDILDGAGAASHWKPKTVRTVVAAYGRWLKFLTLQDELDRDQNPANRVTNDRLRAYIALLQAQVGPNTVRNRIRDLAGALRVMCPGTDQSALYRLARRLEAVAKPSRNRMIRHVPTQRLINLGFDLMRRAETEPVRNAPWQATRYRDGLTIALLALRPIRRGLFVLMELEKHVVIQGDTVTIRFTADETKNGDPNVLPWPEILVPALLTYLEEYRPMLLRSSQSDRIWITHEGRPLTEDGFYGQLRKVMRRELGIEFSPHDFRHALATTMISHHPSNVPHAAALLQHRSVETTIRHYDHSDAELARKRYISILNGYLDDSPHHGRRP